MPQLTMDQFLETPTEEADDAAMQTDAADDDEFTAEERAWIYAPLQCIVYLYACATTDVPIYVGQTLQELRDRDRQHLNHKGSEHSFDRIYTHDTKGQFTLHTLETNEFPAGADAEAAAWMDERETHCIAHHGTYDPTGCRGRNQTPGGQKGAATACRLAKRRAACIKWRTEYMPAFRAWHVQHGTLRHIPFRDPTLGCLVDDIRTRNTAVPDACRAELDAMGFVWCVQQAMWELDYMPAFRAWHAEHGTLRNIPAKSHPTLGNLVDNIRTGNTAVPDACRAELDAMGFLWHARNLAQHVMRRLRRAAQQMGQTLAMADAATVAAVGDLCGSGAFGAASASLQALEARYAADRAKL